MLRNYSVRTDLALEEKERFESDNVEISGVVLEEEYDEEKELKTALRQWENLRELISLLRARILRFQMRICRWESQRNCADI